jgi:ribosomal-protein-serine acetyltransferase
MSSVNRMPLEKLKTLETPFLTISDSLSLRPAELDDAEIYLQMVADNYGRLLEWHSAPNPPNTIEERRKAQAADLARGEGGKGYWWLIESDGDLAGTIAFHGVQARDRSAYVGYWLAESYVGRGVMTASLRAVIDWAFNELGLIRIEIECALINPRSCAVPERLGIRRESIRRQSQVRNEEILDMASYVAFSDNWPPKPPARALPHKEIRVDDEILLRQFVAGDREPMWKALDSGRDYLGKYLPWMAAYKTEQDHSESFDSRLNERDSFDGSGGYIIEYKGELAGTLGFGTPNKDNGAEIGYWLREDLKGLGIVTRAVEKVIDMLIHKIDLHRVTIRAATSNLSSRGIPERLGFKYEDTMRGSSCVNNEYMDLEIYSMLDYEWLARSEKA